jgi:photosystem II stability/assembly factor-like uncharacterized protein
VDEHTGVTDVVMDPRNPDVLVAATYQRERRFYTLIDGGPESGMHRTTDGGATWTRITTGLPSGQMGRIGLAISPVNPDYLYATVEAANNAGGIFRSVDNGVSWQRRNPFDATAMYYSTIFADPVDVDRIYIMNTNSRVSDDGGRTLANLGDSNKHVDNHWFWADPRFTDHYLEANDGGLYETWDRGRTWRFFANLPITQFYDIDVDYDTPFYNVYGGTQDNFSLGGPSRTRSTHGITNADWFVTQGGDGFVSRPDPEDPDIIYAESQHGGIVRYDRRTGERVGIQPPAAEDDPPLRWNWDTPIIISPHEHTRLYMASQFLYRSDDRGNSWRKVSPDLTRQVDRNALPVMGKVWGPDAVAKNASTALYSNISTIAESPVQENLLYVGTDDGIVQVSEDGGANWRMVERFPGVPENAYVARVIASRHDAHTVYVAIENHQNGDFKPYLLRSTDAGRTWTSITGDLPEKGSVYAFAEDHVDPQLLFAGTEFGAFTSKDGGASWMKLAGLPTIAVRDLAIQRRENDLVIGTYGRGVWILDDYTPLRAITTETLAKEATLFPVKDAFAFIETSQYGGGGKAFQGAAFYTAENPPNGAVITYYLSRTPQTLRAQRQAAERSAERADRPIEYPTHDELRAEASEESPVLLVTISDSSGTPIRRFTGPMRRGFNRVAWDLRGPADSPRGGRGGGGGDDEEENEGTSAPRGGPFVAPGRYSVSIAKRVRGTITELAGPMPINVTVDPAGVATPQDRRILAQFLDSVSTLNRRASGVAELASTTDARLTAISRAIDATPTIPVEIHNRVRELQRTMDDIQRKLNGDRALSSRNEGTPPSIQSRVRGIGGDLGRALAVPTTTAREEFALASRLLDAELVRLRQLVERDLPPIEQALDAAGAPHTPGRIPPG